MNEHGRPGEPGEVGRQNDVVVVPAASRPRTSAPTPVLVFAGAFLLAAVTFGSSVVLLTRTATFELSAETLSPTAATTRTATPAPAPVRVTAASGTAERTDTGAYRVIFVWTLDGAREGDSALLRFSVGGRVITEQRGTLDANVFSSSTGRFTLTTSQDCSTEGWSAELVSIRGLTPVGDATSRVAGAACR